MFDGQVGPLCRGDCEHIFPEFCVDADSFVTTGEDLLLVPWRTADENAEDAHPSSDHVQVS